MLRRDCFSAGDDLNQDKEIHRKTGFFSEFQLTPEVFDLLLQKVSAKITKQRTQFRRPISAGERLAVTLRQVSFRDFMLVIAFNFKRCREAGEKFCCDFVSVIFDLKFTTLDWFFY